MKDWCYSDRVLVHPYTALHVWVQQHCKIFTREFATYSSDHQPEISSRLYSFYDYKFMLGVTWKHVDWDEKAGDPIKQALEDSTAILEIQ